MTSNNVSDAAVLPDLLQQLPKDEALESLMGDAQPVLNRFTDLSRPQAAMVLGS